MTLPYAVVDTDVASGLFKRLTDPDYRSLLRESRLSLSFMALAELRRWPQERNWGAPRTLELERFLTAFNLVHSNDDLCRLWAEVVLQARRSGRPIQTADAWMAATAVWLGVPLVTHNRADYVGVGGLRLVSLAPA